MIFHNIILRDKKLHMPIVEQISLKISDYVYRILLYNVNGKKARVFIPQIISLKLYLIH